MNDDPFHLMAVAQRQYNMSHMTALEIQATSKNGAMINEAWDRVQEKEKQFQIAFDNYIRYMQEMEAEFV